MPRDVLHRAFFRAKPGSSVPSNIARNCTKNQCVRTENTSIIARFQLWTQHGLSVLVRHGSERVLQEMTLNFLLHEDVRRRIMLFGTPGITCTSHMS